MAQFNKRQLQALQQMFARQGTEDEGLVSFRAGRLFLDEQTKMVTADKKRGKIKLLKDEQGILKFQWFNRISNQKELDLMIMPTCAKWEKVSECKDGRVFLLRMVGSNRKHFFWMQEPKDDKDDEYFTNINKLCNGQSISDDKSADSTSSTGGAGSAAAANPYAAFGFGGANQGAAAQSGDPAANLLLQALLNQGAAQQAPPQQGNQIGTNNQAAASNNNAGNNNNNNNNDAAASNIQQNLLGAMQNMLREQQQQRLEEMKREPDLEDILDPTANQEITALLDDEKIVEELGQHLPEEMRSREDIIEQLQSPQFQGALRRLQTAINGPQMPTLLAGMGINAPSDQQAMGVSAFVNAIQPNNDKKDEDKDKAKEKTDDDGDASMKDKDADKDKGDGDDMYK